MTLMFPEDFSFPNETPTIPLSIYVRIWFQNREPFLFFVLTIFFPLATSKITHIINKREYDPVSWETF